MYKSHGHLQHFPKRLHPPHPAQELEDWKYSKPQVDHGIRSRGTKKGLASSLTWRTTQKDKASTLRTVLQIGEHCGPKPIRGMAPGLASVSLDNPHTHGTSTPSASVPTTPFDQSPYWPSCCSWCSNPASALWARTGGFHTMQTESFEVLASVVAAMMIKPAAVHWPAHST